MEFKEIEEAALAALNIASKLKDPELTTAMQSVLDKCVAFREEQNLNAPGVLNDDLGSEGEVTNEEPKQDDHFGEEQIDELKNLFAALKDDPGDSRWE